MAWTFWQGLLGIDCQPPSLQQRLVDLGVARGRLVASQVLIELRAVMTRQGQPPLTACLAGRRGSGRQWNPV